MTHPDERKKVTIAAMENTQTDAISAGESSLLKSPDIDTFAAIATRAALGSRTSRGLRTVNFMVASRVRFRSAIAPPWLDERFPPPVRAAQRQDWHDGGIRHGAFIQALGQNPASSTTPSLGIKAPHLRRYRVANLTVIHEQSRIYYRSSGPLERILGRDRPVRQFRGQLAGTKDPPDARATGELPIGSEDGSRRYAYRTVLDGAERTPCRRNSREARTIQSAPVPPSNRRVGESPS